MRRLQFPLLLLVFVAAVNWPSLSVLLAGDIDYDPAVAGEVTLYSTKWCGYCAKTRAFLRKHDVPFTEIDVEASGDGMRALAQMQAYGVPVIVVGDKVIRGYQLAALARALDTG